MLRMMPVVLSALLLRSAAADSPPLQPIAIEAPPSIQFADVTQKLGLAAASNTRGDYSLAINDIDGDGYPELYRSTHFNESGPTLFRGSPEGFVALDLSNREWWDQGGDGQPGFRDADKHGATFFDWDSDGCMELLQVTGASGAPGGEQNWILDFGDANECGGLPRATNPLDLELRAARGRSSVWMDWNTDGYPDLLVLNAESNAEPREAGFSRLFLHNGTTLTPVSNSGLPLSDWLTSAAAGDLNGDGKPELVLSGRDPAGQYLRVYQNGTANSEREPTFILAHTLPVPRELSAQTTLRDLDGDGDMDLLVATRHPSLDQTASTADNEVRWDWANNEDLAGPCDFLDLLQISTAADSIELATVINYTFNRQRLWLRSADDSWVNPETNPTGRIALEDLVSDLGPPSPAPGIGTYIWTQPLTAGTWRLSIAQWWEESLGHATQARGRVLAQGQLGDPSVHCLEPSPPQPAPLYVFENLSMAGGLDFQDVSEEAGLRIAPLLEPEISVEDIAVGDFDLDGDPDLYLVRSTPVANAPDLLFANESSTTIRFRRAQGLPENGRLTGTGLLASVGDLNRDGRLELIVASGRRKEPFWGPLAALSSTSIHGNWFTVDLLATPGAPNPLGAIVQIKAGGKTQVLQSDWGQGGFSQDDRRLHFGVAEASVIDELRVNWSDGSMTVYRDLDVNQFFQATGPLFPLEPVTSP